MRNLFLIGMIVGLAFVVYGLQRADPAPVQVSPPSAPAPKVRLNQDRSPAAAAATRVFDTSHPGYRVYVQKGCQRCHGQDLLGTRLAPALVDARRNFDLSTLGEYLRDPKAYIEKDQRLADLDRRYRMQEMPATKLSEEELRQLAGLILGRDF